MVGRAARDGDEQPRVRRAHRRPGRGHRRRASARGTGPRPPGSPRPRRSSGVGSSLIRVVSFQRAHPIARAIASAPSSAAAERRADQSRVAPRQPRGEDRPEPAQEADRQPAPPPAAGRSPRDLGLGRREDRRRRRDRRPPPPSSDPRRQRAKSAGAARWPKATTPPARRARRATAASSGVGSAEPVVREQRRLESAAADPRAAALVAEQEPPAADHPHRAAALHAEDRAGAERRGDAVGRRRARP